MHSVFQGYPSNPLATFQQYCIVPAEITAKVRSAVRNDTDILILCDPVDTREHHL